MSHVFEIVAHRGAPAPGAPENSLAAFERAVALGADAVELDVRLARDGVPVVYHYFQLDVATRLPGPVFAYTAAELRSVVPTLSETLQALAGRIGLEIEIKGPEPEATARVAAALSDFRSEWPHMEVTSYEPVYLREIQALCPGLAADYLLPRSESWMSPEVVTYLACQRGLLAQARAVHLEAGQLTAERVAAVRARGMEVHAWDVNGAEALEWAVALGVRRVCSDRLEESLAFRRGIEE